MRSPLLQRAAALGGGGSFPALGTVSEVPPLQRAAALGGGGGLPMLPLLLLLLSGISLADALCLLGSGFPSLLCPEARDQYLIFSFVKGGKKNLF